MSGSMNDVSLKNLLETIKEYYHQGAYRKEEAIRSQICYPLLEKLGWNPVSPLQMVPEFPVENLRVDIALSTNSNIFKPGIFIEVKTPGKFWWQT